MTIRVNNIVLDIDEDMSLVKEKALKKIKLKEKDVESFKILRESIDARKKDKIKFNYTVEVNCEKESKVVSRANNKDVKLEDTVYRDEIVFGNKSLDTRPIIVGMGPAGMFAGLIMAEKGYKPIIVERGQKVEERTESVQEFWKSGKLNINSNVQFGEGGAGTFSDGKLTTRIKDVRCDYILEKLVEYGAPEEIIYKGKPHIGTDILKIVVKNIRKRIIELGGEVRFNSLLQDIVMENGKMKYAVVNGEEIPCEVLILAIGHSSRDTYTMLYNNKIFMSPKPFAIGVRVEHLQEFMNVNQYGKYANHPRLKAADYRLSYTSKATKRAVYSFCMCPGGDVVAAASEEERLVTNGMSYYKRDGENANSAIVVSVSPEDFQSNGPLSGMEFQRHYEALAYKTGGGGYIAPLQLLGDFLKDQKSSRLGRVKPTYTPGYNFADLRECLPKYVVDTMKEGFMDFDKKIKGFAAEDTILTGIETRTSAPVRIERNENLESISVKGLYPAGEGAGYAGGIVSAAVDGLKVAENIMKEYKPGI